jgi:hypothetical protein
MAGATPRSRAGAPSGRGRRRSAAPSSPWPRRPSRSSAATSARRKS